MRKIKMIVATVNTGGIGYKNDLIVKSKEDMKHFRETTTGHIVIMGRKTYESIGKALPNRANIIMSKNPDFAPADDDNIIVVSNVDGAIAAAEWLDENTPDKRDIFVIGGAAIYGQFMEIADELIITEHDTKVKADKFFPVMWANTWDKVSEVVLPKENDFESKVVTFKRIAKK